ncbi:SdrD B-like domain-containing protein [Lewinella sp. W8]|uniref:SdrD B-like domain-containing protein n=1 Tax=Lewinella sp. W8 TaxID=2528208 RepID=UPI0010673845|nr:SdrD B-like domain-containing protein [Lewinella sp. W8]MTB53516.1 HYR domain-containing protein [Lewinella sp. W8]
MRNLPFKESLTPTHAYFAPLFAKALVTVLVLLPAMLIAHDNTPYQTHAIINVPGTFATIQAAVNNAADGDEIVVANGTYNESVNVAMAAGDIIIRAANPGMATVNGGGSSAFITDNHTGDVTIDGFELRSTMNNGNSGVIRSVNLRGRLTVSNNTYATGSQFFTDGIYVFTNLNGVGTQLSILNNTFGPFDNDELIYVEAGEGTTTNADVDIVIDGNRNTGVMEDDAIRILTESSNSTAVIVITNNNFSGWTGSGDGINVHLGFDAAPNNQVAHLLIENNVITNVDGDGIEVNLDGRNTRVFGIINNNTVSGNADTNFGIVIDDDSSGRSIEATLHITNNSVSNTTNSGIRYRPFNDDPGPVHMINLIIDGNTVVNPNSDDSPPTTIGQMIPPEEAGIDISDDSGIDDEKYIVNAEITNNTITVTSSNATCILLEEPTTMATGTMAEVNAFLSGNVLNGCAAPFIRGGVNTAVTDPVPASSDLISLGDLVWNDANGNGLFDGAEQGVPGVLVSFSGGGLSGSTTTNSQGIYTIPALPVGTYTVTVTPTAAFPFLTVQNAGTNDAIDSDFDMTTGQATVTLSAGGGNVNSLDAGLTMTEVQPCNLSFMATATNEGCPGANDGQITFSNLSGAASYQFSTDNGSSWGNTNPVINLPDGSYTVLIRDAANTSCVSSSQVVTIQAGVDNQPPTFTCPGDRDVDLDGSCSLVIPDLLTEITDEADNCGLTLTQSPNVGASFASGHNMTQTVTITATDNGGNTNTTPCMVTLTGKDVSPPTAVCNDLTVSLDGSGAYTLTAADELAILAGSMDNCSPAGALSITVNRTIFDCDDLMPGANNGALDFDGEDDRAETNQNLPVLNDFTLEYYVFRKGGDDTFDRITGTQTAQFETAIDNAGVLRYWFRSEFSWNNSGIALPLNQWSHVAWVKAGNNLTIYVNGVSVYTANHVATLNTDGWIIGSRSFGAQSANTRLDEVRIWNLARSGSEVQSNYDKTVSPAAPGLIAYFNMEDGMGALVATDITGNGYDATLVDMDPATDWITPGSPAMPVASQGVIQLNGVVSDALGNSANCTFDITVVDDSGPTFDCPADLDVNLDPDCDLIVPDLVSGISGATDNCGTVTLTQNPEVGAVLASGHNMTHTVTITATDEAGNNNDVSCQVTLTGKDVTMPSFTCPADRMIATDGDCMYMVPDLVAEIVDATDACSAVLSITQDPVAGATQDARITGDLSVTITVADGAGNESSCIVELTVPMACSIPFEVSNNFMGTDPCSCNNDQGVNNGAGDGTFAETVTVTGAPGLLVRASNGTGLIGVSLPANLSEDAAGVYTISFNHTDRTGYSISQFEFSSDGGGTWMTATEADGVTPIAISNVCAYPVLQFDPALDRTYCSGKPAVSLGSTFNTSVANPNPIFSPDPSGTMFTVNGNSTGQLDPATLSGTVVITGTYSPNDGGGVGGTEENPAIGTNANSCPIIIEQRAEIIDVDCGTFPWDGN